MRRAASRWICCQIGAREHYAVPRILHSQRKLALLITDYWVSGNIANLHVSHRLRRLRNRFHSELRDAAIVPENLRFGVSELINMFRKGNEWTNIIRKNQAFERHSTSVLKSYSELAECKGVFAYSYAAEQVFRYARTRGLTTVLGQIDAGPVAERIYSDVASKYSKLIFGMNAPPPAYWDKWRRECNLADKIVVNSEWAKASIVSEGISEEKIHVVPLGYEAPIDKGIVHNGSKEYPRAFSALRPLRVLFLGSVSVAKGIGELLEAASILRTENIEFLLIGPAQIDVHILTRGDLHKVRWLQQIPRDVVPSYMASADVFLFPTHSDGFGLTQLEAQAAGLPIIASPHCGNVVKHQENGLVLGEVTGREIAKALSTLAANPSWLEKMSAKSFQRSSDYRLARISLEWDKIFDE